MEIAKIYEPGPIAEKWYRHWLEQNFFHSEPDEREPFTIVIPPPNVTGLLHMGHMLNNTIQDVLIRRARMQGKNACWVPGTDHASIATEAKVVAMLRERGIKKSDLTREEFLAYALEWKDKYGGIILEQLKKLGASCDWERTAFTMDPGYTGAVTATFIDLYKKGYIYRGLRMVNWDPAGKTALSDEEVIHKEVQSKLYYVRYKISGSEEFLTIATTRPETILADTAICVNPNDERFLHLHGKKAVVPFIGREIPVITDEYVTMEFGTGCLKVTPAHDINDYQLGLKHGLEVIDILTEEGFLNEKAQRYIGMDRFAVRKQIAADLEADGYIAKIEDYTNQVGYSERTNAVIEPRLSLQWFVDMKKFIADNPEVLDAVMNDDIRFHPAKFKNTYRHWIENIKDWCISRQLWWGQRIPAWFDEKGEYVVAKNREEAIAAFLEKGIAVSAETIRQEEDVVDTWFSSWLWPIAVFNGISEPDNREINYYYPTNDLVTAPDIMFFWVARMIMAGYEYRGEKPFSNVYYTGIVRDKQGRKMSKQLGNSPDPIGLIDAFSADGVRVGMLLSSPTGNDLLFDEALCEQGRNFGNKIWNALRLIKGWTVDATLPQPDENRIAIEWFSAKFAAELELINDHYSKYRINDALIGTYKLIWDDFCAWYLEMIKPEYQQPIDKATLDATTVLFGKIVKVLHPFMPFITEEIWHLLAERDEKDCIIIAEWPDDKKADATLLELFPVAEELITQVRNFRKSKNISPKEKLELFIRSSGKRNPLFDAIVKKLGNLKSLEATEDKKENSYSFLVGQMEMYIPFTESVDMGAETQRLEKELEYNTGFLKSVDAKLSNERFMANAKPEIIAAEQKKKADAESKIRSLESQLSEMKKNV